MATDNSSIGVLPGMKRWGGKVALVTGGSLGIGKQVVLDLLKHGVWVAACGRNEERLKALYTEVAASGYLSSTTKFKYYACDIAQESSVQEMFAAIKTDLGPVSLLINNAGLGHEASLINGKTEDWQSMLNVNVMGLSICTREALVHMRGDNGDTGHIVNVSSMSGHRVAPALTFYSGTKHMVRALTEGLRLELNSEGSKVRVTEISPGLVVTNFAASLYQSVDRAQNLYQQSHPLQAQDVSDAILFALATPDHCGINDVLLRPHDQRL